MLAFQARHIKERSSMIRTTLIAGCVLALTLSTARAADAPAPVAKLTAEQIVTKNVAARGGLQAWRAVRTLALSGKMDAGGKGRPTPLMAPWVKSSGAGVPQQPPGQAPAALR